MFYLQLRESEAACSADHLPFCVQQQKVLGLNKEPNPSLGGKLACVHISFSTFIFSVLREILFEAGIKDFCFSGAANPPLPSA